MENSLLQRFDPAHKLLVPFLQKTEQLLQQALNTIDKTATCRVLPAVDLGFPHDVVRIAGGFPTGCYVEWDCSVPFVPIDTTVNIDTSSLFLLEDNISNVISNDVFDELKLNIEQSSYVFNFHKGNHFISFGQYDDSKQPVLVIHSNEKEFKYQFNGLMPTENNWYKDDIKVFRNNERFLRFVTGRSAELFVDIAKSLEEFNIIRHRFIAHLLTKKYTKICSQEDYHHYFMPSRQSVAIGCFPVKTGSCVPIFSRPGRKISIFEVHKGGNNLIRKISDNENLVLVPHGWGKTCRTDTNFSINYEENVFELSGKKYEIKALISLGKDESLELRDFAEEINSDNSFFSLMKHSCPGLVKRQITQLVSYTKSGFCRHIIN